MEKTIDTIHGKFYFRPYEDNDENKVIELWEIAFNNKIDKKVWRWKYHNNPFGRQMMLCLNEEQMPIVMYGGTPYKANWEGREIDMVQLTDSMSHPEYRNATKGRKGLFIQTAEHFFDVFAGPSKSIFYYGFPGKRAYRLGNLFLKYYEVSQGGQYLFIDLKKQNVKPILNLGSNKIISSNSIDFDKLWESLKEHYPLSVIRNNKFFQWRYFDNPKHEYHIYVHKNMVGKVLAYIALTIKNNTATIVDILSKPNSTAVHHLMYRIVKDFKKKGVDSIQAWLPKDHFITLDLIKIGVEIKQEPLGLTVVGRTFNEDLKFEFASKNIYFNMADGDLF